MGGCLCVVGVVEGFFEVYVGGVEWEGEVYDLECVYCLFEYFGIGCEEFNDLM